MSQFLIDKLLEEAQMSLEEEAAEKRKLRNKAKAKRKALAFAKTPQGKRKLREKRKAQNSSESA